jgi:hypothetical protein
MTSQTTHDTRPHCCSAGELVRAGCTSAVLYVKHRDCTCVCIQPLACMLGLLCHACTGGGGAPPPGATPPGNSCCAAGQTHHRGGQQYKQYTPNAQMRSPTLKKSSIMPVARLRSRPYPKNFSVMTSQPPACAHTVPTTGQHGVSGTGSQKRQPCAALLKQHLSCPAYFLFFLNGHTVRYALHCIVSCKYVMICKRAHSTHPSSVAASAEAC